MNPQSRQIYCCGVDCWALSIAWVQLVLSTVLAIIFVAVFFTIVDDEERNEEKNERSSYLEFADLVAAIFSFILMIISFIMGVILLKGVNQRNPAYLSTWVNYAIILLVIEIILKLVTINPANIFADILGILVTIVVCSFLIWVVHIFKKEVEEIHVAAVVCNV